MENWDHATMQAASGNYEQHSPWYNNMFSATNIKSEPGTTAASPEQQKPMASSSNVDILAHFENFVKQQHQQQQQQQRPQTPRQTSLMDTLTAMTPSPSNTGSMQQLLQQQQYQQQFQQAQQAAAQHQIASSHLPLGFDPLTPPGLPNAILPSISQFYHHQSHNNMPNGQQTPSPKPPQTHIDSNEKLRTALTPRLTPPMDITPPKSPKSRPLMSTKKMEVHEKEHDFQSSSEEMKSVNESEDDESIRLPIYNSHGKMKNYKCKSCNMVAITKVSFWKHVRTHMKPEKILQCSKCPFVTELKHHLEYHIRKHKNIKPFQCDECSYTCVNKSMLNSHRKSHSSVYPYRCADCDYATKYCHSFKLHLRKYGHNPGVVLDDEGIPNPSVVIDVYGTRRGPKAKPSATNKRSNSKNNERGNAKTTNTQKKAKDFKLSTSQLSAALQSFTLPSQHHQMPISPAQSPCSIASDLPTQSIDLSQQLTQQLTKGSEQTQSTFQQRLALKQSLRVENSKASTASTTIAETKASISNLLPPLATIFQQNAGMALLPYWNLHVLAAQQQAAVLAQIPASAREKALRQLQNPQLNKDGYDSSHEECDEDGGNELERRSSGSAMDLSQSLPVKDEVEHPKTPAIPANLKAQNETNATPIITANGASRRKGRVLKLEAILQVKSALQATEEQEHQAVSLVKSDGEQVSAASSPIPFIAANSSDQVEENSAECDELINNMTPTAKDTNTNSAASSSGNSSNSCSTSSATILNGPAALGSMYECKYCDIYFKDAVLYTIHMGYHSCDDVFKCNMCGEKCDSAVGLFVHMARNAHS
ncbi:protein hunchback [Anastrepha ludens]|uniref:protein hunchback n=1 Tax=Anastrepha ludens TaxID=28586 RepID=UPI0023AEB98A|nr:protein hunchback [Anastrepha ludens]XP_053964227.1 protein hunchback [Anastrepha ludens]XP_053964232.1 protein hunchback [Anastrepha ludens]XP_053964235.1 protein hunchback [Anastrepha ludens]